MAEWSIAAVLKTVVPRGTGGSNPSLSAIKPYLQLVVGFTHTFTHLSRNTGVAQLVEHWSPKPGVGRSSRSSRAAKHNPITLRGWVFSFNDNPNTDQNKKEYRITTKL